MESKTVGELIDLAVANLPVWLAERAERVLSDKGKQDEIAQELGADLYADTQINYLISNPQVFHQPTFTSETVFEFDVDKLREILDLILEYLPLIIQLFARRQRRRRWLRAGAASAAVLIALLVAPADAQAQCANGRCSQTVRMRVVKPVAVRTAQTTKNLATATVGSVRALTAVPGSVTTRQYAHTSPSRSVTRQKVTVRSGWQLGDGLRRMWANRPRLLFK